MNEANTGRRLVIVGVLVMALFAGLLTRLWFLQVTGGKALAVAAQKNGDKIVQVPALRGRILDAGGRVLAETVPVTSLIVNRQDLTTENRAALVPNLAKLLQITPDEVNKRIDDPKYPPFQPVPVDQQVSDDVAIAVAERPADYPATKLTQTYMRVYPYGTLAAHAVGYLGKIDAQEFTLREADGYTRDDVIGKTGAEKLFESELRGTPELEKVQVDNRGLAIGSSVVRDAKPGRDVQLTLDVDVQHIAETSLDQGIAGARRNGVPATGGATIVLDARTGSIVALASNPTYDPNAFADGTAPDWWFDPNGSLPLLDRALNAYAPGSTFKLISSVAQLQGPDPIRPADETYYDNGCFVFGNNEKRCNAKNIANGYVDLPRALTVSSDTYFYDVGNEFWNRYYNEEGGNKEYASSPALGFDGDLAAHPLGYGIQRTAVNFGLAKPTGVGLTGDLAGRIPTRTFNVDLNKTNADPTSRTWRRGDSASLAVGQGDVLVTPLQLANAYATFANGGTLYTPRVASAVRDPGDTKQGGLGAVVHQLDPQTVRTGVVTPAIRDTILPGLEGAVNSQEGTAFFAFLGYSGPKVAGKTGTATVAGGTNFDTSWFVCFTNADNDPNQPQYVVLSMVEQAGFGAEVSAPIARRTVEFLAGNPNPAPVNIGKLTGSHD